ncbi:MAG TPA: hypothetical protein VFU21_10035, partial [Kofleriaceae bacterium]|nr:hypothetical protein [Kofleriaceae bacterium]
MLAVVPGGRVLAAGGFVGSVLVYGFGVQLIRPDMDVLWALTMVVSLMHFWYDGFIWSVVKKQ